jgi:hypothetical protein
VLHTSLCPSSGYLTNAPPEGDKAVDSGLVRDYGNILIKVKEWGVFEDSDIERNGIRMCSNNRTPVPDFVAKFERNLDSKPGLAPDVCCFLDYSFDADRSIPCRRIALIKLSKMFDFWMHILGLARDWPSRASHQRNLPSKMSLIEMPGSSR